MQWRSAIDTVVFPALLAGQPAELMALQRQFDASQYWPPADMRAQQFRQLRLLVAQAATLPFHAARLRDAGIEPGADIAPEAWARLAPLTRRDLQEQGAKLYAASVPAPHGRVSEAASGGSTGMPVRVRKTALDALLWTALQVREELWNRDHPTGTMARLRGVPAHFTAEQAAALRAPEGLILPDWGPPAAQLWQTGPIGLLDSQLPLEQQVAFLQRLQPDYLFIFPSSLRALLAHCRDHAITLPRLRAVWTLSEVVDDATRALCREVFGVRIVDNYSAVETGYMALQCPAGDSYHVQAETVLLEVLDAQGRARGPGETGRVVVTPLHNFAMPLLRYEIGDEAELGPPCPCGRHLPVLARIHGRVLEHLVMPNGERRRPDVSHYRLSRIAPLREFQVIQRSRERIEALVVVARDLDAAEEAELRAVLLAAFGAAFRIDVTFCASIARTPGGKLRPFICEAALG